MGSRNLTKGALSAGVKGIQYIKGNDGTVGLCCGLNVCLSLFHTLPAPRTSPNSYVESLILNVMVFGDGALRSNWG